MKTIVTFLIASFFFNTFNLAQIDSTEFANLKLQVENLIEVNKTQAEEINDIYVQEYKKMETSINTALNGATALSTLAINTKILKVVSSAQETMLGVNNITSSESMGFDFKEQLIKIATDVLVGTITETEANSPKVQKKKRIKSLINSIVNNDIVQGLIKSNPITSTAYSIINQAFSASETTFRSGEKQVIIQKEFEAPDKWSDFKRKYKEFKGSWNSLGGEFKGINQTQRIILDDAIKEFTAKIKSYIEIYDSLNIINSNFGLSIRNWESKFDQIVNESTVYKSQLANSFKLPSEGKSTELSLSEAKSRSKKLLDTSQNSLKSVIQNEHLKSPLKIAEKYTLLENNTNTAYLEFLNIQLRFIDSYIRILNNIILKSNDQNNDFTVKLKNLKRTKKKLEKDKRDLESLVSEFKKIAEIND